VSAQIVGILLSIVSLAITAILIWGALAEQKRGNADAAAALNKR
jgi:hypothetical protein